ncbi:hypothetical protein [Candidatus Phytoplasma pruni]|uniref:Uncharacterized protein n=1 Tax=Candidatus Phytoplasma pruni TaxID=479893 RepID=A0A851HCC7_9MOLU|nr:hypothetical protein [Candidatus Phytoplasma pruni]NWN45725.1 hypothetical protein [Candidatus Phytoplasma pruni]
MLTHHDTISEAYLFYNVATQPQDPKLKVHTIDLGNFPPSTDPSENTMEQVINTDLQTAIINKLKENNIDYPSSVLWKNATNFNNKSGIILPFKTTNQIVFFVDTAESHRSFKNPPDLSNLLKMSHGAKTVYVFNYTLNKKTILQEITDVSLSVLESKMNNAFHDITNKLLNTKYTDSGSIYGTWRSGNQTLKTIDRVIETFNTIFQLLGKQTYDHEAERRREITYFHSSLRKWLIEAPIQGNTFYTGDQIRNTLGRYSRTLYDVKGNTHSYKYNETPFFDTWSIDGNSTRKKYDITLHTTFPPTPPKGLKIEFIPDKINPVVTVNYPTFDNTIQQNAYRPKGTLYQIGYSETTSHKNIKSALFAPTVPPTLFLIIHFNPPTSKKTLITTPTAMFSRSKYITGTTITQLTNSTTIPTVPSKKSKATNHLTF